MIKTEVRLIGRQRLTYAQQHSIRVITPKIETRKVEKKIGSQVSLSPLKKKYSSPIMSKSSNLSQSLSLLKMSRSVIIKRLIKKLSKILSNNRQRVEMSRRTLRWATAKLLSALSSQDKPPKHLLIMSLLTRSLVESIL